jgi:hypothetical protein
VCARDARAAAAPQRIRATMRVVAENTTSAFVNIDGNHCAASISAIHASGDLHAADAIATRRHRSKVLNADSESSFLAMKKFSCISPSRRFGARQDPIFARIVAADSQLRLLVGAMGYHPFGCA